MVTLTAPPSPPALSVVWFSTSEAPGIADTSGAPGARALPVIVTSADSDCASATPAVPRCWYMEQVWLCNCSSHRQGNWPEVRTVEVA